MKETLVVDASVAVKWVIAEEDSALAVALRAAHAFVAPELILSECANILWKKVQRGELLSVEAVLAAKLLERSGVEFASMRGLSEAATALACELGHPAYDCVHLSFAWRRRLPFVTADVRFLNVVRARAAPDLQALCVGLKETAKP